jgi:hypothetical protein
MGQTLIRVQATTANREELRRGRGHRHRIPAGFASQFRNAQEAWWKSAIFWRAEA